MSPTTGTITPTILVVVGASGAGKTTLVSRLAALRIPGVGCYHFDSMDIPSAEEMARRFADGFAFQAWGLDQWLQRFTRNEAAIRVAVLDAQVRPSDVRDAFVAHGIQRGGTVLLDCSADVRNARLAGPRRQPELASSQMDGWAAYLRGQADALGVPVIDTTAKTPESSLPALLAHVLALLEGPSTLDHQTRADST